jgi:Fic family protein
MRDLKGSPIGSVVKIEGTDPKGFYYTHSAYIPDPLPGEVKLDSGTWTAVSEAMQALGSLGQACAQLPNPGLMNVPSLALEAQSTSALEGTHAALYEILGARLPKVARPTGELREVLGYEEMANHAFESVSERPISVGMLAELQGVLAASSRVPPRDPGRIRQHQVVIGPENFKSMLDARYVPPPPGDQLALGLSEWERWVNQKHEMPIVLEAALTHYQFESLHPFADGNGRVGRLVIILQLLRSGALAQPALTISPWFLRNRTQYIDLLFQTSATGNWNPWVRFFSRAIKVQCERHVAVAQALMDWVRDIRQQLQARRWAGVVVALAEDLVASPIVTAAFVVQKYAVSKPTAKSALDRLVEVGVLTELTGKTYRRAYGATAVMNLVESL